MPAVKGTLCFDWNHPGDGALNATGRLYKLLGADHHPSLGCASMPIQHDAIPGLEPVSAGIEPHHPFIRVDAGNSHGKPTMTASSASRGSTFWSIRSIAVPRLFT